MYELTNRLDLPFMAGFDTRKPSVQPLSNLSDSVRAGVAIADSFRLNDNIANLSWRFESSKGGESFSTGDTSQSGTLSDTIQTVAVTIPGKLVSQDNGVRALLIVTDGTYIDTVDVSRRVMCDSSDLIWTAQQQWTPMSASVVLDTTDAATVLSPLAGIGQKWKYDNTKFRIFRWYSTAANAASSRKWVEYADSAKQVFTFARGNLLWVKSKIKTPVRFGRGVTPSLTQPFSVTTPAGQWVDLALPFKFDITVADIIGATKDSAASDSLNVDSLQIYEWQSDKTGKYTSNALYINTINDPSLNNAAQPLSSTDPAGFTFYNPSGKDVRLVFPPVPQALSAALTKKKASAPQGWAVKVISTLADSSKLSPVYCGFSKSASTAVTYYPAGPSFGTSFLGVLDRGTSRVFGHAMAHSLAGGGCAFLLAFVNDGDGKQTFLCRLDNLSLLPDGIHAALYDDASAAFEDVSKGPAAVTADGNSKSFRWLLVGPKEYLAKAALVARPAVLSLFGTYPNPFASVVHIRYGLPYDGVDRVVFGIYDMRGRTMWISDIRSVSGGGTKEFTWNGRSSDGRMVAPGVYILRMTACGKGLRKPAVFEKKMTFVP